MQRWRVGAAWGIVLFTLGVVFFGTWLILKDLTQPHATVTIGSAVVRVDVARTSAERTQGLSGVDELGANQGMLFVFDKDGAQPMWMKDMKFSLDIIWLSSSHKVVHVEHDLSPDTYPQTFGSATPARYVLEVPAGFASENRILLGKTATFDLP